LAIYAKNLINYGNISVRGGNGRTGGDGGDGDENGGVYSGAGGGGAGGAGGSGGVIILIYNTFSIHGTLNVGGGVGEAGGAGGASNNPTSVGQAGADGEYGLDGVVIELQA